MENMNLHERYIFRNAVLEDCKELAEMEKICFAENEVCSYENVKDRVEKAAEDFLIVFDQVNQKIAPKAFRMRFLRMPPYRRREERTAFS